MNEDKIKNIVIDGYRNILKREPDYNGLENYVNQIKKGLSIENFHKTLMTSDEYIKLNEPLLKISFNDKRTTHIPSLQTLLNETNKITIICPTYNNLEYFSLFYTSYMLSKKDSRKINLIVAINGNDIETEQFCIRNNIEHVIQKKLGMYSVVNLAAQKVTDGYIMIINDDIYLDDSFFIDLDPWLSPNNVLTSKSIQPIIAGGTFKDHCNYGELYSNFDRKGFLEYCKKIKTFDLLFHNFGVVYLIHSSNWFIINGFDERFDPYGGGMADLMYRLYLSGIRNFWLMNNVLHYHFIRKCATKHNLSRGDVDTQLFTDKWKKDFSKVDEIIKNGCKKFMIEHKNNI